MNSVQLTPEQLGLEDIITPAGVSWWPLAIGWWLLIALIIITLATVVILWRRHQKKWRYRKQALQLLKKEYQQWKQQPENSCDASQAMCALLKRTAINAYSNKVSPLFGSQWLEFLNQQTPKKLFENDVADIVCRKQYQANTTIDIEKLYQSCQQWIKQHHTQIQGGQY